MQGFKESFRRRVWYALSGMCGLRVCTSLIWCCCCFSRCAYFGHRVVDEQNPTVYPLMQVTVRLPHKLLCYVTFSIFCIMGTYFGLHIEDSIANTRAIGAVMGGLLGGPVVGGW